MKGKIFSVELSALIPLILLLSKSEKRDVLLFLGAVILHEAGHWIALVSVGCSIQSVTLSFSGASMVTREPYLSYRKELRVFLAGPLAGLLGCLLTWAYLRWHFTKGGMLFFSFNLLLSLFNLLPVKGLDGGGALYSLLCLYGDEETSRKITSLLNALSLGFLLSLSLWILHRERNASLLLLTLALMASGTKRKKATITS